MPKKGVVNNPTGRPKGVPNKATMDARRAIAIFVDASAGDALNWIVQIAAGEVNEDGEVIRSPDPKGAFQCWQSLLEYHIPKLARTELVGDEGKPITLSIMDVIEGEAIKLPKDT